MGSARPGRLMVMMWLAVAGRPPRLRKDLEQAAMTDDREDSVQLADDRDVGTGRFDDRDDDLRVAEHARIDEPLADEVFSLPER